MSRKRIAFIALVGILTFLAVTAVEGVVAQAAELGDTGTEVTELQTDLRELGYVGVVVDGRYGPRTQRAVMHFQRANRLLVDGIAGPITTARIDQAADGTPAPAVRLSPVVNQPPAPPAPAVTGNCAEWADEMAFFGLPDSMRAIMHRESRCRPDVTSRTGCCHGLFQIHRIHLPKPECQAYSESDLFDPVKNICVASVIYKRSGMSPWAL